MSKAALVAVLTLAVAPAGADARSKSKSKAKTPVEVQLLGVNDFHGALEPVRVSGRPAGGAAFLDAYLEQAEAQNPRGTIKVHAGDMVGASPLISSWFHDEPSILALNEMEFDVGTLGNHEFDEGGEEMLRLIRGGHREDGKQFKTPPGTGTPQDTSAADFPGADFPYIAANTRRRSTGRFVLPPLKIVERKDERIAFIGVTTEDTPNVVLKSAIDPFVIDDISDAVNRWVPYLRRARIETIVVLAHAGGNQVGPTEAAGEIVDEAREMSDAVDVVVAGHTHSLLNNTVDGKLIVSAFSNGTAYDHVKLAIDRRTNDVVAKSAVVPTTFNDGVTPESDVQAVVDEYRAKIAPIASSPVGQAAAALTRATTRTQVDSVLGNVIADAQRAKAGTQIALMNPGGIRADLDAGEVTYGELFTVQPFDNQLHEFTITGAQLKAVLAQQVFSADPAVRDKILQISGFTYTMNRATQTISDLKLADGTAITDDGSYTAAANEFLTGGGDGFTALKPAADDKAFVSSDLDALVEAFVGQTVSAPPTGRITAHS
jgi:5'-nucleotidase